MKPLRWSRILAAILGTALAAAVAAACLPDNEYQRFQLVDGTIYDNVRWSYERMHFDPRPVDIAIVGPSRSRLGLSAGRIAERLAAAGHPAEVANFSIVADGRNVEWLLVHELLATKRPKTIIVAVNETPNRWGHPAFKYIAPASAIAWPPAPFLHNSIYDLMYLPYRQLKLFAALAFPDLMGLRKTFDPAVYAATRSDFTTSHRMLDGRWIEMGREIPRGDLLEQAATAAATRRQSAVPGRLTRLTDADDRAYVTEIAREAKAHGTRLLFVFIPIFNGSPRVEDRAFYERHGRVLDNGDLAQQDRLYQGWAHLNHAGAMVLSDRVAAAIAGTP